MGEGSQDVLLLLFLANTDAVALPQYCELLLKNVDALCAQDGCGPEWELGGEMRPLTGWAVELTRRLLDNGSTPPEVLLLLVERLGVDTVKDAVTTQWKLQQATDRMEDLNKTFFELFPTFNVPTKHTKQAADELLGQHFPK